MVYTLKTSLLSSVARSSISRQLFSVNTVNATNAASQTAATGSSAFGQQIASRGPIKFQIFAKQFHPSSGGNGGPSQAGSGANGGQGPLAHTSVEDGRRERELFAHRQQRSLLTPKPRTYSATLARAYSTEAVAADHAAAGVAIDTTSVSSSPKELSETDAKELEERIERLIKLRLEDVISEYDNMISEGLPMNTAIFNVVIKSARSMMSPNLYPHKKEAFDRRGQQYFGKVMDIYSEMLERQVLPDAVTYENIIGTLLIKHKSNRAVCEDFASENAVPWLETDKTERLPFVNDELLSELKDEDCLNVAFELFTVSTSANIQYTTKGFNQLIDSFAQEGQVDRTLMVLEQMENANVKPGPNTLISLITAFGTAKDMRSAVECFNEYKKDAHKSGKPEANTPSTDQISASEGRVYGALVQAYCKAGNPAGAIKFFEKLPKMSWYVPVLYGLIDALCDSDYRVATRWLAGDRRNLKVGHEHDDYFIQSIMCAAAKQKDVEGVKKALDLLPPDTFGKLRSVGNDFASRVDLTPFYAACTSVDRLDILLDAHIELLDKTYPHFGETFKKLLTYLATSDKQKHLFEKTLLFLSKWSKASPVRMRTRVEVTMHFVDGLCEVKNVEALMRVLGSEFLDRTSPDGLKPIPFDTAVRIARVASEAIDAGTLDLRSLSVKSLSNLTLAFIDPAVNALAPQLFSEADVTKFRQLLVDFGKFIVRARPAMDQDVSERLIGSVKWLGKNADVTLPEELVGELETLYPSLRQEREKNLRERPRDRASKVIRPPEDLDECSSIEAVLEWYRNGIASLESLPENARKTGSIEWDLFLLRQYIRYKKITEALEVKNNLYGAGFIPDQGTLAKLVLSLQASETRDEASLAMEIYDEFNAKGGVLRSTFFLNVVLAKLAKARRVGDLTRVLGDARAASFKKQLAFSEITYGTLINGYARCGDEHTMLNLFTEMLEAKSSGRLRGDRQHAYNSVMIHYLRVNPNREKLLWAYETMRKHSFLLTSVTWNLLLQSWIFIEPVVPEQALAVIDTMRSSGVPIESTHHASLIEMYGCVLHNFEAAERYFNQEVPDELKDALVYQSLLKCYVANHNIVETLHVLNDMEKRGVQLNAYMANYLIKGWANIGDIKMAKAVFQSLDKNVKGIYGREPSTYEQMVRAFVSAGARDEAEACVEEMKELRYPAAVISNVAWILNGGERPADLQESTEQPQALS
ncbi:hypothetical protein SAICODRAFT_24724 [Saitoella complicata NRRL Y-17804]|uniref:Pentatricopeptide repeat-containing protein-mitochondrial domain-containing protein n=1 Tax=Saitoella complicata (strain BCRC 22490 / CBS 7301 / JCM 7358 / NBRC 10748 / NRRL Y-17804) TaxID=698492 RepID=A0A0E9NAT1_SAICN|nr:uncharacterized protein SAICODRAFT_24724 [Saitoella complicata NRRL Y-17804]ODQ53954.1 hypothetical protein SAICODRAFT_24724 [Saitoella complicata NRRL Y-17804]GAO46826.1 hypothetical protein G7K_1044-t1 [Saitoella complicata NRRL Y-17804]